MTIDWFTFAAQILNFLVLIWLMKKFLYGPIVDAMEQREARIAARLTDAAAAETTANAKEDQYTRKLEELANTRQDLLARAGIEIEEWRQNHVQQAKDAIENDRERWRQSLAREKATLLQQIQLSVTSHAADLSRHVLKDMADASLQSLMVERFLKLIRESSQQSTQMSPVGEQPTIIETAYELPEAEQVSIRERISAVTPLVKDIRFQVNPELICGIQMRSSNCKLGWNIQGTVADIESDLLDCFNRIIPDAGPQNADSHPTVAATEPVSP